MFVLNTIYLNYWCNKNMLYNLFKYTGCHVNWIYVYLYERLPNSGLIFNASRLNCARCLLYGSFELTFTSITNYYNYNIFLVLCVIFIYTNWIKFHINSLSKNIFGISNIRAIDAMLLKALKLQLLLLTVTWNILNKLTKSTCFTSLIFKSTSF